MVPCGPSPSPVHPLCLRDIILSNDISLMVLVPPACFLADINCSNSNLNCIPDFCSYWNHSRKTRSLCSTANFCEKRTTVLENIWAGRSWSSNQILSTLKFRSSTALFYGYCSVQKALYFSQITDFGTLQYHGQKHFVNQDNCKDLILSAHWSS